MFPTVAATRLNMTSRLNLGREKTTIPKTPAAESHGISHGIYDVFNFWLTLPTI
jgi:hypothetical protein